MSSGLCEVKGKSVLCLWDECPMSSASHQQKPPSQCLYMLRHHYGWLPM